MLGNITFPNDKDIATHVLTFIITDTASKWKHVVCYFFTGDSFDGEILKDLIFQIIDKAKKIDLHLCNLRHGSWKYEIVEMLWNKSGTVFRT